MEKEILESQRVYPLQYLDIVWSLSLLVDATANDWVQIPDQAKNLS